MSLAAPVKITGWANLLNASDIILTGKGDTVAVCGEGGVGKSCLTLAFLKRDFSEE